MAKVTEGKLVKVEYGYIKTKETIDKKVVVDSKQRYSLITLDTGDTFNLSCERGRELEAAGIGSRLKVTQDNGTITVEAG